MGAEHATVPSIIGLTPDAQDHFQAVSLVLRRYGLNLAAARDPQAGHDILMMRTMPPEDLEYKHVLAGHGAGRGLWFAPQDLLLPRVVVFECRPPRPVLEIQARPGEGITLTVLDPSVPLRFSVDGTPYDLTSEALPA